MLAAGYLLFFALATLQDRLNGPQAVSYTDFKAQVARKNVSEIFSRGDTIEGALKQPAPLPGAGKRTYQQFTTERPTFAADDLLSELSAGGASVRATPIVEHRGMFANLLISLAPIQILTEMDGFSGSEGVVVLAATNRPDVLDPALLRPGRFDRTIMVHPPDQKGRAEILRVHTRRIPLDGDVHLELVASATPGMTGAELANLANEAALLAARAGKERVSQADLMNALEKVQLGTARKVVIPEAERRRTACHEAGHALLGMLQPGADPIRKVSIIPRGRALGVTLSTPESDRYGYDAHYLRGRIVGTLGGMAAEQEVFGVVTTGAESDLEVVTRIARAMVGRWGMSDRIGRVSVFPADGDPRMAGTSDALLDAVDEEVRRIIDECYVDARRLLRDHRGKLDAIVAQLLAKETLDEAEVYAAAGIVPPGAAV